MIYWAALLSGLRVLTDGESFETSCLEDGLQPTVSVVTFRHSHPPNGSRGPRRQPEMDGRDSEKR